MSIRFYYRPALCAWVTLAALCACGSKNLSSHFTIGGSVSGLVGTLTLANHSETLQVTTNGPFAFTMPVLDGTPYHVTVATQPERQTCTVQDADGTVKGANVVAVAVSCTTTAYTIGGTITGLVGSLTLANGNDTVTVTQANPNFTFATAWPAQTPYAVTITTQPAGQHCTIAAGSGTLGDRDVSLVVSCGALYNLSLTVTGLEGSSQADSVQISNDQNETLTFTSNTTSTFTKAYVANSNYTVTLGSVVIANDADQEGCSIGSTYPTSAEAYQNPGIVSTQQGVMTGDISIQIVCQAQLCIDVHANLSSGVLQVSGNGQSVSFSDSSDRYICYPTGTSSYHLDITPPADQSCGVDSGDPNGTFASAGANYVSLSCH